MAETYPPPPSQWPGEPPPPQGPAAAPLPWEDPGQPFLEALFETAKLFVTAPGEAFARMRVTGDLGRPLMYAVIFGWIGIIASQAYDLAFRGAMWQFMPGMDRGAGFALPVAWSFALMILAPVFVLLGLFLWSAILHVALLVLGGAQGGFGATIRTLCYTGTTSILNVIPFCGGFIGGIWGLVLAVIGLSKAHGISQGKAILAVLLPLLLCCACIVAAIAIGVGAGIGLGSGLLDSFR